jgi:hypothetical protein
LRISDEIASFPDFIGILAMTVDFPSFIQPTSEIHITCRVIASPTKKGAAISYFHPPSLLRVIARIRATKQSQAYIRKYSGICYLCPNFLNNIYHNNYLI